MEGETAAWSQDALLFLAIAGVVVPLFSRLRVSLVLGFILAGVLFGPGGLGRLAEDLPWLAYVTVSDEELIAPFADLGILFLLFTIGLELSLDRLWAMRRLVFGAGTMQVLATTLVVALAALALGLSLPLAITIGLALSFSSTAIILQVLTEEGRLGGAPGPPALGILLMQDLMVVPAVIVVGIFAGDGEGLTAAALQGIGVAIVVVAGLLFAGRYVTPRLLALAAATHSRETLLAIALLAAIGSATLSAWAGLSPALGAFLAGLLLGGPYRHQVEVDIEPFKGLLLGLFFLTVGMSVDIVALIDGIGWVALAVAVLLAAKGLIAFLVLRLWRQPSFAAVEVALLLAGGGEFAFVLFGLARSDRLADPGTIQFLTTVVAISMILTPALGGLGRRLATMLERRSQMRHAGPLTDDGLSGHIVIGGFGRVGEMVARVMETVSVEYAAVDLDGRRVEAARRAGRNVHFGDSSRPEILERVGAARARAFVVTADLPAETDRTVSALRAAWPQTPIYARARDAAHAVRLRQLGAFASVPEAVEGSLQLAALVLEGLENPDEAVDDIIDKLREEELGLAAADGPPKAVTVPPRAEPGGAVGPAGAVAPAADRPKGGTTHVDVVDTV